MITLFHEFGHALHGLFANQTYPSLSGTNTARDFVEFPSQFNENFATLPEVLPHFAKHWQTGEAMPAELLAKIDRAKKFNQGYALGEILAASLLDLKWHTIKPGRSANAEEFEKWVLPATGLRTDLVPPRYHSSYFRHIWDHGYGAGYYSYTWTEMISHDAWAHFMANGGLTRANGDLYRQKVLSRGNTMDYEPLYEAYAGRAPSIDAMLEARGLVDDAPKP
jgi:peptidyl-dipeptidase Dcp